MNTLDARRYQWPTQASVGDLQTTKNTTCWQDLLLLLEDSCCVGSAKNTDSTSTQLHLCYVMHDSKSKAHPSLQEAVFSPHKLSGQFAGGLDLY